MNELLASERQTQILQRLKASGKVLAADLAVTFSVSEDTIRRDLRTLAGRGLCERVYGGALTLSPSSGNLATRQQQSALEKQRLGQRIAAEIKSGMTVFLDASSTNLAAAKALSDLPCTIITNAPAIAAALDGQPSVTVIMIGGIIDRTVGGALGSQAVEEVGRYRPDLCILGACGIDPDAGLTCFSQEDAILKRAASANAKRRITSSTVEKLRTRAPFLIVPLSGLSGLVISGEPDTEFETALARNRVTLLKAEERRIRD